MTADRADFYPLRIFVIEDHRDTLEALQIYLEQLGHVVFSARSKAEALKEIPRARKLQRVTKFGGACSSWNFRQLL